MNVSDKFTLQQPAFRDEQYRITFVPNYFFSTVTGATFDFEYRYRLGITFSFAKSVLFAATFVLFHFQKVD